MDDETTGKVPDESAAQPPAEGERGDEGEPGTEAGQGAAEGGADTGETVAMPPADEGATQVMPGEAEATRVMPPPPAQPPLPPRPSPTLMLSRPPKRQGGSNAWWIILLIIIAAAAAAAVWFFVLRSAGTSPSPSPSRAVDWSGAWGRTDGAGGGLIIQGSGSTYQVTLYDGSLNALGVASAKQNHDKLTFTLATQASVGGLTGPFSITLTMGAGHDTAQMQVVAANQDSVTIGLRRIPSLLPASPNATPTPTTSGSPTSSASPSPNASPTTAADQQVINGVTKIQVGVITWATNNNNLYPSAADVAQTGAIAQYVTPWPTNPFTNLPMAAGTQPGNYTYEQLNGGSGYTLTAYLQNGLTYTLP
jgi:hypothetical protein